MIAKAPLRISLFGGGSDLPMYRELTGSGGCVLSCTIDTYVQAVRNVDGVLGVCPVAPGSGLGGSGALHTVLALYDNPRLSGHDLFQAAWQRETEMNRYAGWQDVAAATFGGLNLFTFEDELTVQPIPIPSGLNERLLLFATGITRKASEPLALQAQEMSAHLAGIRACADLARIAAKELLAGRYHLIGSWLDWTWDMKQRMPGVTNERIDHAYATARNAGATGGKLCGAGGGGYLLFYVEPDAQASVRHALMGLGLDELVFSLTTDGASVV